MADENQAAGDVAADAGTGASSTDPGSTTSEGSAVSAPSDYLERARHDSEFAVAELRKHQGRADRAETQHRELLGVLGGPDSRALAYMRQLGPEALSGYLEQHNGLMSDPRMRQLITQYLTNGSLPDGEDNYSGGESEEFMTPEDKRIQALEQQVATLQGRTNALTSTTGSAALQGHLEKVFEKYHLNEAEAATVKEGLETQARAWGTNDQGRRLLHSLQEPGPQAFDTVEALALKYVPEQTFFEMGDRKRLHDRKQVEGFATDGPLDSATTGQEPPVEVKGALNALRAAKNPAVLSRHGY